MSELSQAKDSRENTDAVVKAARELVTVWNIYRELGPTSRQFAAEGLVQQLKLATLRLKNALALLDESDDARPEGAN